jgi:hypothetical protein
MVGIPFTQIADRDLGRIAAANVVALGALPASAASRHQPRSRMSSGATADED